MQDFKAEGPMQTAIRRMHPDITKLSLLFFKQLFRLRTFHSSQSYLVAQLVNNPPAMQETRVWSLGWEDPLEKELGISFFSNSWEGKKQKQKQKTLQYSCLENFMDREAWWDRRVRQDWGTDTFTFIVQCSRTEGWRDRRFDSFDHTDLCRQSNVSAF